MTIPSKTRRTFTRNNFAEHNYNYTHSSKTNYPPRKNNNNHIRSRYWNNPMATTNSVNFQANPHPPQDHSENYPFFQQNKNKKQAPHQTDYLSSDDDHLQPDIFAPYTQEYRGQGMQKPYTHHRNFSPHQIDTQNQQPIQMQNPIKTQSFQPIPPYNPLPSISTPSYASQVTPTYSSLHSDRSSNSPDTPQISQELDNFITLQQQPLHLDTSTINQISSTKESSNPPTPTPSSAYTASLAPSSTSTESSISTNRAYRTFKRKFPNHPFPTKPGIAREYINHPNHTNTKDFLAITLPSFPQYTLNTPNDTNDTRSFVDEQVLMPTLHWTSYYHFTNPLCLPLSNTHIDIERNQDMLYRLTTPLTHRQFTYIGYKKSLKTYTAPRANEYTLEYYDHNIIRTNQDQFLDDDRFANPQITEKFFIKTPYVFTLNIFDRKFDHIISDALTDTQAYESFKERFQLFSLTFHFLAPHERDLHCSHDIMLRTKQTHTYTYYRFIQNHFDLHTPSRQPHHRFQFINSKYTSPFFLNFTYCIKDTNLHGILRNFDPITQMYIFCPSQRPSTQKNPDPSLSHMNLFNL